MFNDLNLTVLLCFDTTLNVSDLFQYEQAREYCSLQSNWSTIVNYLDMTIGYSMIVTGVIGLVGSFLMLITFLHKSMGAPGYLYYRAMSSAELVHMIVLIEYGIIRILHFPPSSSMQIWKTAFEYGWSLGDWVKLSVAALTVFVSVERFAAIWMPMTFAATVDRRRAAYSAVLFSAVLGGVHGFTLVLFLLDRLDRSDRSYNFTFAQIETSIGYIKLTLCMILASLTVSIVLGLRLKSKRLTKMKTKKRQRMCTKDREQWQNMRMRCYLQLIPAVSTLIDHVAWFAYRMLASKQESLSEIGLNKYDNAMEFLRFKKLTDSVELVQVITGELLHCGKFYLYFLLHTGFRQSFFKVMNRNKNEITDAAMPTHIGLNNLSKSIKPASPNIQVIPVSVVTIKN